MRYSFRDASSFLTDESFRCRCREDHFPESAEIFERVKGRRRCSTGKSTSRTTEERAKHAAEASMQRPLAMRTSCARDIHHERPRQRDRYSAQKQRPPIDNAQQDKHGGNG